MTDGLAAVVLAAGRGRRLRPLTDLRPKPLCPVAGTTLLDLSLGEVEGLGVEVTPGDVAVNAHHLAEQLAEHVDGRVHLSLEEPVALGTAGAVGLLREWVGGRAVLVRNGDAWRATQVPLSFVADWDGRRPRLLVVADAERPDFGGRWRYAGVSLLAWADASRLPAEPCGLYEAVWAEAARSGRLDLVPSDAEFVDCGTPPDYLRANLAANGGESVVGRGAVVEGELVRSVVWPDGVVRRGERLVESIRVGVDFTVPAPLGPTAS